MPDDEQPEPEPQPFHLVDISAQIAEMNKQYDLHHLGMETWRHDVRSFLNGLTKEQAVVLRQMFNIMSNADSPTAQVAYWLGMITMVLDNKHEICNACGRNHENELQEGLQNMGESNG